jgi:N-carbamoylputrescine amidase
LVVAQRHTSAITATNPLSRKRPENKDTEITMDKNESTRVAAIAMESAMAEPDVNLDRIETWAAKARAEGASFAVFPEECITGSLNKSRMSLQQARAFAEAWQGRAKERLEAIGKKLAMTLVVGTIEPGGADGRLRNSALIVGPSGYLATFTKVHIPNGEQKWFEPGERVVVVKSQGWCFSVGICYDLNFPEIFRAAALAGADFFLLAVGCSGGPEDARRQRDTYARLMHASAVANAMYIFYANQVGEEYAGLAFSCDPDGEIIDSCIAREGMIITEVVRERIRAPREGGDPANVFRLRPDAYANPLIVG